MIKNPQTYYGVVVNVPNLESDSYRYELYLPDFNNKMIYGESASFSSVNTPVRILQIQLLNLISAYKTSKITLPKPNWDVDELIARYGKDAMIHLIPTNLSEIEFDEESQDFDSTFNSDETSR